MKKSWLLVFLVLLGGFIPQQAEARCLDSHSYHCKEKEVDPPSDGKAALGLLSIFIASVGLLTYYTWKYEGPEQALLLADCFGKQITASVTFGLILLALKSE